ncbi:MAG: PEP-utilizing enzyme [Candidatus Micrarchaeota archaeon]|nr:PEP-utilizing enzyme [Candidatus Micrarchaeota archaeon]
MKKLLSGVTASNGKVEGVARVVVSEADFEAFQEGEILVVKITDPTMVIIMNKSAAIICDIGGIGSHPAIISRELGIPCIVNTKTATTAIKSGMKITIDASGTEGAIYGMD